MVDTQEDYLAWLGEQQTFAQLSAPQEVGSAE
jgi:cytochrome c oxidase subunit 2